jgi:hypothetical protein
MEKPKHTKAEPERHSDLPDFILLFKQIGQYLKDPGSASAADLKIAREAFHTIIKVLYCEKCSVDCVAGHPHVPNHWL